MSISHFTPSMNDPALLEAIFTAREPTLQQLLSRIRDSAETGNRHYSLLIGPRGIGKSHLVSLVYYRVKADAVLSERLRIAWLIEDPYAVDSYAGLLREILLQLESEYGVPRWAERLATIQAMTSIDDIERALEGVLVDFVADRVLLVLAENLDTIFDSLGDSGQKRLRSFLQTRSIATLLVTSPSLFAAVEERERPFFGTFKKYELNPFGLQDCIDVLVRMAKTQEDEALAQMLGSPIGRARIRAIHHIAGGNPRIYVIFYQFLTRDSLEKLIDPFMKLVNDLVPYYQSRMQTISPQQRRLIDTIRRHESPIAVRDIAKAGFSSSQSASSDLGKLRELGYLISTKVGRESLYELREPLMRICLAAKEQRGHSLALFVDFLRLWFTPTELQNFDAMSARHVPEYERYDDAIKAARKRQAAKIAFELQRVREYEAEHEDDVALELLQALHAGAPDDLIVWSELRQRLEKRKDFGSLIELARQRVSLAPDSGADWNYLNYASYMAGDYESALAASTEAIRLEPKDAIIRSNHLANLSALGRHDDARAAAALGLEAIDRHASSEAAKFVAECQGKLGDSAAAIDTLIDELRLDRSRYEGWRFLHVLLDLTMADRARLTLSRFATIHFPDDVLVWRDYATALAANGFRSEAVEMLDKAITLEPDNRDFTGERLTFLVAAGDLAAAREAAAHTRECVDQFGQTAGEGLSFALAMLYAATGAFDDASAMLRVYVERLAAEHDYPRPRSLTAVLRLTQDPAILAQVAAMSVAVFAEFDAVAGLGTSLVAGVLSAASTREAGVDDEAVRRWLAAWRPFASEAALALPLRLMNVAARYRETLDDAVLLELPVEQREILRPHVERYRRALGLATHPIDARIDELVRAVRARPGQRRVGLLPDTKPPPFDLEAALQGYSARRRIADPLPRLLAGRWMAVGARDAAALLARLQDTLGPDDHLQPNESKALRVLRIDRMPLSFSGRLHQAHVEVDGRLGAFDFWADGDRALLLDGSGPRIHEFFRDARNSIAIALSPESELDYVRFFCSALRAGDGRFRMLNAEVAASRKAVIARLSKLQVPPPRCQFVEGKARFVETVLYSDRLFEAQLVINREKLDTTVNMVESHELTSEPLGLPTEEFAGPIRFWKREEAVLDSLEFPGAGSVFGRQPATSTLESEDQVLN